jgi:ABC-type glycerol-3-phosphate transport system substrate-binding protein
MKKVTFILALGVVLTLAACGSESTATQTTDSTVAPVADTTAVVADSTVAPVEGGAVKDGAEKPVSNEAVK